MQHIQKPGKGEYAPYAIMYIKLLPDDGLVLQHLQNNLNKVKELVLPLSEAQLTTPCAPGEWTIKEILAHISDDERVIAYRALRFARNDPTELPGIDPDLFTTYANANPRSLEALLDDLAAVRKATITLFKDLDAEALTRSGKMGGHKTSVRATLYHIAGHELHHLNSIKENYGLPAAL